MTDQTEPTNPTPDSAPDIAVEAVVATAVQAVADTAPAAVAAESPAVPEAAIEAPAEAAEAAPIDAEAPEAAAEAAPSEPVVEDETNYTDDSSLPPNGFTDLGLSPEIVRAVTEKGYLVPTPIQAQAIPYVLMGRDLLGCAQTGTGKTAGFTLPMLDILSGSRARARMPRSLILEPTRELALQVAENFVEYGKYLKLTHALVIGGESMSDQKDLLMRGVDVLIATPGRLIDMFDRGTILLTDTRVLVIDEADRMLDMGFIPDVERIVSLLPANRQTLFFSATMAPEIRRLADAFLQNPKEITVSRPASVATTITEGLVMVAEQDKREAVRRLIRSEDVQNALIFCNRKRDVDILYKSLTRHGFSVGALHGDMAQPARFATLEKFKAGEIRLLCCSDVAARGIDIGGLSHVFNFDVPTHAEDYVHRIGRTGRAGREGRAFTIAMPDDRQSVEAIQKLTGHVIPPVVIPGLDPVEWTEGAIRRGRGGRKPAAAKPTSTRAPRAAKPKIVAEELPAESARRGRQTHEAHEMPAEPARRGRQTHEAHEMPAELAPQPDLPPIDALPEPRSEPRGDRRPRGDRSRGDRPREDRPREDRPREDRPRESQARDDRPREDRPRDDRPRDDRPRDRDRDRRRRDDDLGPSVLGFGDEIPAFMLVTARRRPAAAQQDDMES